MNCSTAINTDSSTIVHILGVIYSREPSVGRSGLCCTEGKYSWVCWLGAVVTGWMSEMTLVFGMRQKQLCSSPFPRKTENFFFFGSTRVWTQGLILARQMSQFDSPQTENLTHQEALCFMMELHPDKPILNWKYLKSKMHLLCLACWPPLLSHTAHCSVPCLSSWSWSWLGATACCHCPVSRDRIILCITTSDDQNPVSKAWFLPYVHCFASL
jgi:hypothetical protein